MKRLKCPKCKGRGGHILHLSDDGKPPWECPCGARFDEPPKKPLIAWMVTCCDHECVAFAETKAAARWRAISSRRDAGYDRTGEFSGIQAWRWPDGDRAIGRLLNAGYDGGRLKSQAFSLDFVLGYL